MNIYLIELVFINILLLFLFSIYQIIKDKLNFLTRRFILLMLPFISVFSGIINYILTTSSSNSKLNIKLIELDLITISDEPIGIFNSPSLYNINDLWYILVLGTVASLIYSCYKIIKVTLFFFKSKSLHKFKGYNLLISDHQHCFSFFKFIHLSAQLDETERNIVLEHELIHVKKKHSFDLILMELYQAFFWYNPLLLLMKKELIIVQEYDVDKQMFRKYGNVYISNLLNHALGTSSSQLVLTSQFFNQLSLAKRTKIMKKNSKKTKWVAVFIPITALLLMLVSFSKAPLSVKTNHNQIELTPKDSIYEEVDVYPVFPGGDEAMMKYIVENFHYPPKAKKDGIVGKVYTGFVVTKEGKVTDVKILKGVSPEIDAECVRVIESMPKWIPGEVDGKKVSVSYVIPINVTVSKDE